ncbi:MAG: preprotein translocase subunit SecG [Anaerolineales bacterium]|nr:preprotein translocase subunit SecG [Anaerolineales bacterium]
MLTYLYIIQVIISVSLVAAVLLQTKGSGLGGMFGGQGAVYTSRRGVEKTIFQVTIGLSGAFLVFATIIVILAG